MDPLTVSSTDAIITGCGDESTKVTSFHCVSFETEKSIDVWVPDWEKIIGFEHQLMNDLSDIGDSADRLKLVVRIVIPHNNPFRMFYVERLMSSAYINFKACSFTIDGKERLVIICTGSDYAI